MGLLLLQEADHLTADCLYLPLPKGPPGSPEPVSEKGKLKPFIDMTLSMEETELGNSNWWTKASGIVQK